MSSLCFSLVVVFCFCLFVFWIKWSFKESSKKPSQPGSLLVQSLSSVTTQDFSIKVQDPPRIDNITLKENKIRRLTISDLRIESPEIDLCRYSFKWYWQRSKGNSVEKGIVFSTSGAGPVRYLHGGGGKKSRHWFYAFHKQLTQNGSST